MMRDDALRPEQRKISYMQPRGPFFRRKVGSFLFTGADVIPNPG